MKSVTLRSVSAAAVLLLAGLVSVNAQEKSRNVIGAEGDWTAFAGQNPKECWAVSPPKSSVHTDENGNPKEVTRGDIRLYISYRPGQEGVVSFAGGYPFASGSNVEVDVGGKSFNLFTEGENAWPGTPADDQRLISALRAGSTAVVTGRSSRGTITKDTFSLSGVTSMTNTARSNCN